MLPISEYEIRIIVAGTRNYNDYEDFSKTIANVVSDFSGLKLAFISGDAKTGADALIIKWCEENNYHCFKYPAKWKDEHGNVNMGAGYKRNSEMAEAATHLIAFYDGISKGTKHMIGVAGKNKLSVTVKTIKIIKDEKFTFFFGSDNPLSQWYISYFTVNNVRFNCCEQFMMYCKAKVFGDEEIAKKILASKDPAEQKRLGRKVKGYTDALWHTVREKYVRIGNLNKFKQNPELKKFLLATGNTILVEAAKNDLIWGVGLSEDDPRIHNPKTWLGLNLLGKVLIKVRDELK